MLDDTQTSKNGLPKKKQAKKAESPFRPLLAGHAVFLQPPAPLGVHSSVDIMTLCHLHPLARSQTTRFTWIIMDLSVPVAFVLSRRPHATLQESFLDASHVILISHPLLGPLCHNNSILSKIVPQIFPKQYILCN